jgi:muramoyltetrapeptide carboxypeptidase
MTLTARPLPGPLHRGARIGIGALSGTPDPTRLREGVAVLESAGYRVVLAPNLERRDGYLAGSDRERLAGLDALLAAGVDAIIAARGGYGLMRVLDDLPWERLAAWGGWLVGFSDVTALHAAAAGRLPVATLHGPVGTTLARDGASAAALFRWLEGTPPRTLFRFRPDRVVRPGMASGVAVGGNLSLLAALTGTPYEPAYADAVLFIEDVGEAGYRLDRLLTQLSLSSRLARVKAIIVGQMVRCGRGEPGWRERWRVLLAETAPATAVVVDGLAFGHGSTNTPFPVGAPVSVDTTRGEVTWGGE